jgi:hypothetical protein
MCSKCSRHSLHAHLMGLLAVGLAGEGAGSAVLAVLEVLALGHDLVGDHADLVLAAGVLGGLGVEDGDVLAPVDDEGLADEEQHDGDLRDAEEAPDGGLLLQVGRDEGRHHGAEQEQEAALQDHALLLVQREEGSEHEERVDAGTHDVVGRVGHGHGPAEVHHGLGLEGAQRVAAQPLSGLVVGRVHGVEQGEEAQEVAGEKQEATDQAQALDDHVAVLVLA